MASGDNVRDIVFEFKRATQARWLTVNPILALGEPGFEQDTGRLKIGNGVSYWSALPYTSGGAGGGSVTLDDLNLAIETHVDDLTPHPNYDDGTSFDLLYENAKV